MILTQKQKIGAGAVVGVIALIFLVVGIYLVTKKDTKPKPTTKPNPTTKPIVTSIFDKRRNLPYGMYYITNGMSDANAINSVVTISDTKLVLETKYKNENYVKKEFPFPLKPDNNTEETGVTAYRFSDINMGKYNIDIFIKYYEPQPCVGIVYYKGNNKDFDSFLQSPALGQPKPAGFKLPS